MQQLRGEEQPKIGERVIYRASALDGAFPEGVTEHAAVVTKARGGPQNSCDLTVFFHGRTPGVRFAIAHALMLANGTDDEKLACWRYDHDKGRVMGRAGVKRVDGTFQDKVRDAAAEEAAAIAAVPSGPVHAEELADLMRQEVDSQFDAVVTGTTPEGYDYIGSGTTSDLPIVSDEDPS